MAIRHAEEDVFGCLVDNSAFRADLLYFTRLAGNYAASIFIAMRSRAQSKHRKMFAEWLDADPLPVNDTDGTLRRALVHNAPWFDTLKREFPIMLEEMQPDALWLRLDTALQQDHALPLNRLSFIRLLDDLREYRHWLEHYKERKERGDGQPVSDTRLLEILGLMLLPFMGNHLLGRMRHHGRRLRLKGMTRQVERAKSILDKALAGRREASKYINGLKRKSDHETIRRRITTKYGNAPGDQAVHRIAREDAKKRRDLESRKTSLVDLHRRYFIEKTWPRYNYENFLIRFAFIGSGRIAELEELIAKHRGGRPATGEGATGDFIQAIEPLFMLSADIGLIIHGWLAELKEQGVPIHKKKKVGSKIIAIRNTIAHGGWFWTVDNPASAAQGDALRFGELLEALLELPAKFNLYEPARWCNDLLTRTEGALRPCAWHYVYRTPSAGEDPNRSPERHVVKRWTAQKRARFGDKTLWRIERRAALRRVAATWMRDVKRLREQINGQK